MWYIILAVISLEHGTTTFVRHQLAYNTEIECLHSLHTVSKHYEGYQDLVIKGGCVEIPDSRKT